MDLPIVDEAVEKKGGGSSKTFKRVRRNTGNEKKIEKEKLVEKKRNRDEETEMDVYEEGRGAKVGRFADDVVASKTEKAGPADRSCGTQ